MPLKINASGENWKQFMRFSSNHFALNATQKLQVWQQNPNATCLATFNQWKRAGKYVRRGQHGIRLSDGDNVETYFDLSQTDSKPLGLWKYTNDYRQLLVNELNALGRLPVINNEEESFYDVIYKTTIHSLNERYSVSSVISDDLCDFVAQSVAYSTMNRLAVEPNSDYDFEQVRSFNNEELSFLITTLSAYTNLYLKCAKKVVKSYTLEEAQALASQQQKTENESTEVEYNEYQNSKITVNSETGAENETIEYDDVVYQQPVEVIDNNIALSEEKADDTAASEIERKYINSYESSDYLGLNEEANVPDPPEPIDDIVIETVNDREDSLEISQEIKAQILKRIVRNETKGIEKSEVEKKFEELKNQSDYFKEYLKLIYGEKEYSFDLSLRSLLSNWNDPLASITTEGFFSDDKGIIVMLSDDNRLFYNWTDIANEVSSAIDDGSYHYARGVYKVMTASSEQQIYGYNMFKTYRDALNHAENELNNNLSRDTASYLIYITTTSHIVERKGDFPLDKLEFDVRKANNIEVVVERKSEKEESEQEQSHILTAHDRLMVRNYKLLERIAPQILSGEYSYMHFESPIYEPLSIENIGYGLISVMQTYEQNGDLMRDPDIVFDTNNRRAGATSYENSGLGIYREYDTPNYDCDCFASDWFNQIISGNFRLTRAVRSIDGEELSFDYTEAAIDETEEPTEVMSDDKAIEETVETEEPKSEIESILDDFLSDNEQSSSHENTDTNADDSALGTIASTGYLIPSDLNEKINQITEYLGADREILLDLLSRNPTEETINELGLFNRLKDSVDLNKATAYYRSLNDDPELPMHKAGVWSHKFLKEFILSNGEIDLPIPTSSNDVENDIIEEPYELRKYPDTRFTAISDENRELYRMYQPSDLPEDSIWGEIQTSHYINKGIYEVSTASHGGVIMPVGVARYVLSREARREAQTDHGYVYFEEDCDWSVAFRELLDKGLFENIEEYYKETYAGSKDFNGWLKELDRLTDNSLKKWHNDYYVKRSDVIHKAMSPEERDEEMGQIALFGFSDNKQSETISLMSDTAEIQEAPAINEPEPITLDYYGNADALNELRDNVLSLGAVVTIDNSESRISVSTYENHHTEIDTAATELGLVSLINIRQQAVELADKITIYYDTLYQYGDNALSNYDEALAQGQTYLSENALLMQEIFSVRHDLLTSDREIAAFGYALADLGLIEDFRQSPQVTEALPDAGIITMRKVGAFYEMYGTNAHTAADILGLHILQRDGEDMVGFPEHIKDKYADTLKTAGYSVLIEEAYSLGNSTEVMNSSDDLKTELLRGTGFANGKQRVHQYYVDNQPSISDFAKFLKSEYGIGGHSGNEVVSFVNYDSKGIQIKYRNGEENTFSWNSVAKLTEELITNGDYLPESDIMFSISDNENDIIKEGNEVTYRGKHYIVDKIDTGKDTITLREQISGWYPVFHDEKLSDVAAYVTEQQSNNSKQLVELEISAEKAEKNFRITDRELGVGGPKHKFNNNIAAIRTLKSIEAEQRAATDEEKVILSQYVGWGGISEAFNEKSDTWSKEYDELKELLTDKEYTAARASVTDAFYTQPTIIEQIYKALENFGFKGGRILEPACGVGNFIGCCPESLSDNSKFTAIEIDSISGRIARLLYPRSEIQITGYENAKLKENYFDVAIGNVPFGQTTIVDRKYNKTNAKIHDYFFLKTVEMVRPNGIIAFITSSGTMDKTDTRVREMISEKAEFIGAVRLPNTAFKSNAGTEVTADIVFLQKRDRPMTVRESWINIGETEFTYKVGNYSYKRTESINQYYAENPDMVCGELRLVSARYGTEKTVEPFENTELENVLSKKLEKLRDNVVVVPSYTPSLVEEVEKVKDNKSSKVYPLIPNVRETGLAVAEGVIFQRAGDVMLRRDAEDLGVSQTVYKDYLAMTELALQAKYLRELQTTDIADELLKPEQDKLLEMYNTFIKRVGHFNDKKVNEMIKKFESDDLAFLSTVETYNPDTKTYSPADYMDHRTTVLAVDVTHADTADDAYQASFAQKGYIDLEHIAKLCDKTVEECISELNGVLIFRDPDVFINGTANDDITKGWISADEYLSGEVVRKLKVVEHQAQFHKELEINRDQLQKVQPERISAADISVQLGSPFVHTEIIEDFIWQTLERDVKVEHNLKTARWLIQNKSLADHSLLCTNTYGTSDRNALYILENCLNLTETKIYDTVIDDDNVEKRVLNTQKTLEANNKAETLKEKFTDWVFKDAKRARMIEDEYNSMFNSTRLRSFDGSHLQFPGKSTSITLKKHQVDAVARILYGPNALLAHVVGAGKTYTMCASIMEQKRIGSINKALIVVPNHLLQQWGKEFKTLYPGANILLATSADFQKENRKRFLSRIAINDYDAIIMGSSTFSRITVSPEKREQFYKHEIEENMVIASQGNRKDLSVKDAEIRMKQLENTLKKLEYVQDRDSVVYFEELGVDALYVDEAHLFKNLRVNTRQSRLSGITTSASKRAEDMMMKIQYITEKNANHKGVVFATGTPVSNSMTEMYVMQKYLQSDYLKEKGLEAFDSWLACYGKIERSAELSPTGNWRMKTRCAKFNNVPELMKDFRRIADIQTREMLNLAVPELKNGKPTICISKPSPEQKAFILECADRAEAVHMKLVPPTVDNMLCITNDGKMCALDMRLIDPNAEDNPNSKINMAVENILAKWEETKEDKLTQAVFLDRSTPSDEFNLYDDIKQKLIRGGVPASEIAYIHDAKTDNQKLIMFDKVNRGDIRIILGSTEKMGAGTNMQEKLCALHHIDVPWRPSDIEQREGRILRQGNKCENVEIFRYVTEETFDSYSWQTIEIKQKFISQIMTDKPMGRSVDDLDEASLSYAEIKMLATGDPRIKEQLELQSRVTILKSKKSQFDKEQISARDKLTFEYPKQLQEEEKITNIIASEVDYVRQYPKPSQFKVTINGTDYFTREDAGKAVKEIRNDCSMNLSKHKDNIPLCKYRGFDINLQWVSGDLLQSGYGSYQLQTKHKTAFLSSFGVSHEDVFNNIDTALDIELIARNEAHSDRLKEIKSNIAEAEKIVSQEFPFLKEYTEKNKQLLELTTALQLNDRSDMNNMVVAEEDSAEKNKININTGKSI